ncbi:adaptor protein complex 3 [Cordyceps militaris CM01]|uniref:Adaptor protein complex 3 n=1 Tax=Cordyceps militaris (strain CM01) TaxID=983644 RepID=G3JTM3_CORMM|nr:adaptor protein complex 3 [Cordyceps militaris CM01]EGX88027.1 adaptor protein complex 3 [Cordyceps militaris CM01]
MGGVIEAVHIFDDNSTPALIAPRSPILSHEYAGRPLSAAHLLPLYLEHPAPRPNLIYLANTNPPTLVFSLTHGRLLFLATSSSEIEPLLVLEFLHRVVDALEDFVGAPLLAVKIENNYDIVAQLLTEMCDAGHISTTEPNALREVVEVEGWVDKLLGSINLPGKLQSNSATNAPSLLPTTGTSLPWRRANVRHTSNEMYADVVETFQGLWNPGYHGQPHQSFWETQSGELYGTTRLPSLRETKSVEGKTSGKSGSLSSSSLKLPVNLEMKTGLGPTGSEFEVRLQVNKIFGTPGPSSSSQVGRGGVPGRLGSPHPGTPASPLLDDLVVTIPLPADVRNLSDIRPSRGDASFNPGQRVLEWHIATKELSGPTSHFGLRSTVVGAPSNEEQEDAFDPSGSGFGQDYSYNEPYQSVPAATIAQGGKAREGGGDEQDAQKAAQNKILMPSSASVNFSVKGWLASGLKVDSIVLDTRKSRGLGEGVKPYKGVKYLTVSKGGVELRC